MGLHSLVNETLFWLWSYTGTYQNENVLDRVQFILIKQQSTINRIDLKFFFSVFILCTGHRF